VYDFAPAEKYDMASVKSLRYMTLFNFLTICKKMDRIGYHHVKCDNSSSEW
jgi:hypothetical protein